MRYPNLITSSAVLPRECTQFPGLKPGDGWCLCALRWKEAYEAGVAPPIKPEATHERALEIVDKRALEQHYVKRDDVVDL